MNGYTSILKTRLRTLVQYRSAAFAGICTQVFWGLIDTMIFTAFYQAKSAPITLQEAITFIWINQSLLQLIPWSIDKELGNQIRTGNIAYELVRPLDLYWHWFCRSYAIRVVPTIMRSLPIFIVGSLLGILAPVSVQAGFAFVTSCFLATFLASSITTIILISLFWTISGEGIQRLMPAVVVFFSGLIVPLPLFPDWAQTFISLQPLRGVLDIPCRIYTGVIPQSELPFYLAFQLFWTALFIVWGKNLMQRAVQKVVIQGG